MASLKKLTSIPTLTQLYRTGKVLASSKADLPASNQSLNDKICTIQYDITQLEVDAIVNAANSRLMGGGGVDGAIHRAAGPKLLAECRTLNGCKTGSAKITDAYNLPSKKIIHAVGPIYDSPEESEPLLRGCYRTALQLAVDNQCKSIAFSAISTGIYGYPSDQAAETALNEVKKFLENDGEKIDKVIFCNFMQKDVDAYTKAMPLVFPPTDADHHEKVRSVSDSTSDSDSENSHTSSYYTKTTSRPSATTAPSIEIKVASDETKANDRVTDKREQNSGQEGIAGDLSGAGGIDVRNTVRDGDGTIIQPDDTSANGPRGAERDENLTGFIRSYGSPGKISQAPQNDRDVMACVQTELMPPDAEKIVNACEENGTAGSKEGGIKSANIQDQQKGDATNVHGAAQLEQGDHKPVESQSELESELEKVKRNGHDHLQATGHDLTTTLAATRNSIVRLSNTSGETEAVNQEMDEIVTKIEAQEPNMPQG